MEHDNHEEIHLPSPSIAPIVVAAGITFALVGLLSLPILIVGAVMTLTGIALWVFSRA